MDNDITNEFTVKFGRSARTVDYVDSNCEFHFSFDFRHGDPNGANLNLEVGDADELRNKHGARFDAAIQRVVTFLESHYGVVRVMEFNPMTEEEEQRYFEDCERVRAKYVSEGTLTIHRSWFSRCREALRRFFV